MFDNTSRFECVKRYANNNRVIMVDVYPFVHRHAVMGFQQLSFEENVLEKGARCLRSYLYDTVIYVKNDFDVCAHLILPNLKHEYMFLRTRLISTQTTIFNLLK